MAERVGLIRAAQDYAPKPLALPLSHSYIRFASIVSLRSTRHFAVQNGGEGGIRTHVSLATKPHFECGAFDHSATSPFAKLRT